MPEKKECPGPHLPCQGCSGEGLIACLTLYVGERYDTKEMPGSSTCRHCDGAGVFCKSENDCGGDLRSKSVKIYPPV